MRPGKLFAELLCLGLLAFSLANAVTLSRIVATGDLGRQESLYRQPLYGFKRQPPPLHFAASDSTGRFGADYACLYFSAKNLLENRRPYAPESDPWGRPAVTFPPHLVFLTALSLARLPFPASVLLSLALQIAFLVISSLRYLKRCPGDAASPTPGSEQGAPMRLAAVAFGAFLLFCTSVGTTWLERSQSDLYVASACLLFMKGIRDDSSKDFIASGFLASLKWSSLPFLGLAGLVYLFADRQCSQPAGPPDQALRARLTLLLPRLRRMSWAFAVPVLLLVPFGSFSVEYLRMVAEWEALSAPTALSLALYLPGWMSKLAPFLVPGLLLYCMTSGNARLGRATLFLEGLFWCALGPVAASFGTVAYEYRLVSTLYLLPLFVDGRSVFFAAEGRRFSGWSGIAGVGTLLYAFRVDTHVAFLDRVVSSHRGLVPFALFTGVTAGLILFARSSRVRPPPGPPGTCS